MADDDAKPARREKRIYLGGRPSPCSRARESVAEATALRRRLLPGRDQPNPASGNWTQEIKTNIQTRASARVRQSDDWGIRVRKARRWRHAGTRHPSERKSRRRGDTWLRLQLRR